MWYQESDPGPSECGEWGKGEVSRYPRVLGQKILQDDLKDGRRPSLSVETPDMFPCTHGRRAFFRKEQVSQDGKYCASLIQFQDYSARQAKLLGLCNFRRFRFEHVLHRKGAEEMATQDHGHSVPDFGGLGEFRSGI